MSLSATPPRSIEVRVYRGDQPADAQHTYVPVVLASLVCGSPLPFDLYQRRAEQTLEVILPRLETFTFGIRERIRREGGEQYLYVRQDENDAFLTYREDHILDVLSSNELAVDTKCLAIQDLTTSLSQELLAKPTGKMVERQRNQVARMVEFTQAEPGAIRALLALTHHDYYTYTHSVNVGLYGLSIATAALGDSAGRDLPQVVSAFFLHDIGKSRVRAEVVNKPGALTDGEWREMRQHPSYGYRLLEQERVADEETRLVVLQHHERMDGKGYPEGLRDDQIHLYARICSIADAFDALTTNRAYRRAVKPYDALEIMKDEMHAQFDGEIFTAFVRTMERKDGDLAATA